MTYSEQVNDTEARPSDKDANQRTGQTYKAKSTSTRGKHPTRSTQKIEREGYFDKNGFFIFRDGSFEDPDGYYFDKNGYDDFGGYYDDYNVFHPPSSREPDQVSRPYPRANQTRQRQVDRFAAEYGPEDDEATYDYYEAGKRKGYSGSSSVHWKGKQGGKQRQWVKSKDIQDCYEDATDYGLNYPEYYDEYGPELSPNRRAKSRQEPNGSKPGQWKQTKAKAD